MDHFHDFEHALRMGMLLGQLMKAGVPFGLITDDDGAYTSVFVVYVNVEDGTPPVEIRVQVLG